MEKLTEEYIYENYLEESESILYSQLPEKKRLYLKGSVGAVIGTLMIFSFAIFIIYMFLSMTGYKWVILPVIIAVLILLSFCFVSKTSTFVVTDKRVLIFTSLTFKEVRYDGIRYVEMHIQKNKDIGFIRLYTKISGYEGSDNGGSSRCLGLYDVEDVGRVANLIKSQMLSKDSYKKALEKVREAERMQGYKF